MCESVPSGPSAGDVAQELGGKGVKVLWWLLSKAVPAILVAIVWWLSGTPILPRQRRYARRVHVAGRLLLLTKSCRIRATPELFSNAN